VHSGAKSATDSNGALGNGEFSFRPSGAILDSSLREEIQPPGICRSESFPSPGGSGHEIRERFPLDGVKAGFFPGIRAHVQPGPAPICYFRRLGFTP